ncbi:MAG: hypothetical protein JXA30_03065 [Deltaproteobacteria bacterium]|nr:hypothetical protein [Deltaproteobacteria bacterium]
MREVNPYRTESELMKALDNGGHLYNIMSRRGDNVITYGELAKAAGAISTGIYAFLFFEMSQQNLPDDARAQTVKSLEPSLQKEFLKDRPIAVLPSEIEQRGKAGKAVIVEGYAKDLEDEIVKHARVSMAVSSGGGTAFESVSLIERFAVFELCDTPTMQGPKAILACDLGTTLEPGEKIRFGGILSTLSHKKKKSDTPNKFLEAIFFTKM